MVRKEIMNVIVCESFAQEVFVELSIFVSVLALGSAAATFSDFEEQVKDSELT